MSWDPRDYDGVTYKSERAERDEARELQAQADEEERAREMAFHETPFCEDMCFETLAHSIACQALNTPRVIEYVDATWLRTPSVGQELAGRAGKTRRAA